MAQKFNPHDNRTSDGVVITMGMRVLDYNRRFGTVTGDTTSPLRCERKWCDKDHWFEVTGENGGGGMFNGTRLQSVRQEAGR